MGSTSQQQKGEQKKDIETKKPLSTTRPITGLGSNQIISRLPRVNENPSEHSEQHDAGAQSEQVKKVRVRMRVCKIVKGAEGTTPRCTFTTVTYLVPVTEIKRQKKLLQSLQERSRINRSRLETEAIRIRLETEATKLSVKSLKLDNSKE